MTERWNEELIALGERAVALERDIVALLERIAEADGDISTMLEHRLSMLSLDAGLVGWVRREHFRKLGQPVPEQPGPRDLE